VKIEIGKTYAVSAYWKKSLSEIEQYKHEDTGKMLNTEVLWRNGTFMIRMENEEERAELESTMYIEEHAEEEPEIWDFEAYENIEMDSTFDGVSEDWVSYGSGEQAWAEGEFDTLQEKYEEDLDNEELDYFGAYDWLEDNGYQSLGCNWQIHGGTLIEESSYELEAMNND